MIKYIPYLLILLLGACNEEVPSWDDLSAAEQAALRTRQQTECLADSATHFSDFINNSDYNFYDSSAYAEGTTFNHTFSEGSTTKYTNKITIWKVTASDVYLLIDIDDTNDEYRFLKIPKTTNDAMITDLQTKYCDRSASQDTSISINTSSKTYKKVTTGSTKEMTYTFTYSTSLLAFLSKYKESRKEQPLDSNGDATGTAISYTGTLSSGATETNIPKYDTFAEYVATGIPTTLCLVDYSTFPYGMNCDKTGSTTFPSTEL